MLRIAVATAMAVTCGAATALAQKAGSIVAWGSNCHTPGYIPLPRGTDFVAIASAWENALVLKANGSVVPWGMSVYGLSSVPPPNADFVAVAAAGWTNLGLKFDGSIVAWGYGLSNLPVPNSGFTAIASRGAYVLNSGCFNHALGLRADGSIEVWSDSYPPFVPPALPPPAPNTGFVAIAAGGSSSTTAGFAPPYRHALGLRADGSVVAWGDNDSGQCDVPAPNTGFVAVSAGDRHSLALRAGGSVVAWGDNASGQCSVPAPNTGFVAVAGGSRHTVGLKSDGTIVAWGDNTQGHLNVPAPNTGYFAIATSAHCSYALLACYPDCSGDGSLSVLDFTCFQNRFAQSNPYTDCNTDGKLTVADFACFQTAFVTGCP